MTAFLHARLHRDQLRDTVTAQLATAKTPPRLWLVLCPSCGDTFFADRGADSDVCASELEQWEALAKLDGECPDHPHWFVVGPYDKR